MTSIILITGDLMFQAKIQDTAKHFDIDVHICRSPQEVKQGLLSVKPALVLLDLTFSKVNPLQLVSELKSDSKLKHYKILAFGPHVQRDLFVALKHKGCDEVMPRSKFSMELARLLGDLK